MHINNKFNLNSYIDNIATSKIENSLDKRIISDVKETLINIINYCDAVLMQECNYFENFTGRDVDTFFLSKKGFLDIKNNYKDNFIFHKREKGSYRFLVNHEKSIEFMNLDVEDLSIFSPSTINLNKKAIINSVRCKKTGLKHIQLNLIIFYKLIKYFGYGVVFSYEQLFKIKQKLNSISSEDLNFILDLTAKYLPKEKFWIIKLIECDFYNFEKDKDVQNFWIKKRKIRQNKRKVFAGKPIIKNLFKSKRFLYAILFGSLAKWPKSHCPLPSIAIIGNDGAGKTSLCNFIIKNFSKMDPLFINMKSDEPILPFTNFMNKSFKKILSISLVNKVKFLKFIFSFMGQSFDLFDQFVKYRIGMAFCDSGHGVTIFERYITDKIRGEFPNKDNKFLPLEQFFPFPDGFFYLDVKPEITLQRKKLDGHTIEEMRSKRINYISLLEEFDEVKMVAADNSFEKNIKQFKNYVFELALKKKNIFRNSCFIKRCLWKKNRKRILAGDQDKRFQKGSFL